MPKIDDALNGIRSTTISEIAVLVREVRDVGQIDEVEYGSDLVSGAIADSAILRLRAHGRAFEFVLDTMAAERWCHILPPHRMDETGSVRVMQT